MYFVCAVSGFTLQFNATMDLLGLPGCTFVFRTDGRAYDSDNRFLYFRRNPKSALRFFGLYYAQNNFSRFGRPCVDNYYADLSD